MWVGRYTTRSAELLWTACLECGGLGTVWPDKNRQMSIKVTQNDFTRKIIDFDTFKNCLTIWAIWVKLLLPPALNGCPKSKNRPIWTHWQLMSHLLAKYLFTYLSKISYLSTRNDVSKWRYMTSSRDALWDVLRCFLTPFFEVSYLDALWRLIKMTL